MIQSNIMKKEDLDDCYFYCFSDNNSNGFYTYYNIKNKKWFTKDIIYIMEEYDTRESFEDNLEDLEIEKFDVDLYLIQSQELGYETFKEELKIDNVDFVMFGVDFFDYEEA